MFIRIFNLEIKDGQSRSDRLKSLEQEHGFKVEGDQEPTFNFDEQKPTLKITFKGKSLSNIGGTRLLDIIRTDELYIIRDNSDYQNLHAYDLQGNWVWDIEKCMDHRGNPKMKFGSPIEVKGDLLFISNFPYVYSTNIRTGEGTKLEYKEDDTDFR